MKHILLILAILTIVIGAISAVAQVQTDSLTAHEVLDRVNTAWQGDSFHGIVSLNVVLGEQTKSHRLEIWTLGEELALVRVLAPEADADSGYLQLGDQLWYYAPAVGAIELPAIAIGDALFGAGPSLEDLSHSTLSDDYDVSSVLTEYGYKLTLIPRADAPVVYGRLEISVTPDFLIETLVYYDQRGDVLQTATFADVTEFAGRKLATTITIEDAFGDKTIEHIEFAQFDLELDASFFRLEAFETWRSEP